MTDTSPEKAPSMALDTFPHELLLAIVDYLDPIDISCLGQASSSLYRLTTSEDVWKSRCVQLWNRHRSKPNMPVPSPPHGWSHVWYTFLAQYACLLGWWALGSSEIRPSYASSAADLDSLSRGRLLRFSLSFDDKDQSVYIEVNHALTINLLDHGTQTFTPADPLPPTPARFIRIGQSVYSIPDDIPTPDAGLQLQLLDLKVISDPLLYITKQGVRAGLSSDMQPDSSSFKVKFVSRSHTRCTTNIDPLSQQPDCVADSDMFLAAFPNAASAFPNKACLTARLLRAPECLPHCYPSFEQDIDDPFGKYFGTITHARVSCGPSLTPPASTPTTNNNLAQNSSARIVYQTPPQTIPIPDVPIHRTLDGDFEHNHLPTPTWFGFINMLPSGMLNVSAHPYFPIRGPNCATEKVKRNPYDPRSLEGLWCGTYGPTHGLEWGYISVHINDGKPIVEYLKITGDSNVPRGQVSWRAFLTVPSDANKEDEEAFWEKARLQNVQDRDLVKYYDRPDSVNWDDIYMNGEGIVAYPGFNSPSTIKTKVMIVRSGSKRTSESDSYNDHRAIIADEEDDNEDGDDGSDYTINEIRVAWIQLRNISTFKRVIIQ